MIRVFQRIENISGKEKKNRLPGFFFSFFKFSNLELLDNGFNHFLTLSRTSPCFYVSAVHGYFENTVGKGEIARNKQFFLFPQCFLSFRKTHCHFHQIKNFRQSFSLE